MFKINSFDINETITILVKGFNEFFSNFMNFSTIPSFVTSNSTITFDRSGGWTVLGSPEVFFFNDTGIHFTHVNRSVVVEITFSSDGIIVILREIIIKVDRTR